MKKIIRICLLALMAALCCCACNPYLKLEVRDARISSVNLFSNPASATVELEVYNPSRKLEITEIQGTLKIEDQQILHFTCDTLTLEKRCVTDVSVPLKLTLAEGVGLLRILSIAQAQDLSNLSVDVYATVTDLFGIRHRKELVNFKLSNLK